MKKTYPYWIHLTGVIASSIFTSLLIPPLLIFTYIHFNPPEMTPPPPPPAFLQGPPLPPGELPPGIPPGAIPISPEDAQKMGLEFGRIPVSELPPEMRNGGVIVGAVPVNPMSPQPLAFGEQIFSLNQWQVLGIYIPGTLILSLLIGFFWGKRLSRPVQKLVDYTTSLREGQRGNLLESKGPKELVQLSEAINQLNLELQESELQRQNFMVDICHDFRTPITVLNGNIQAIADGIYPLHLEEIQILHAQVKMLNRLVNDVQFLGLFEAKQFQLNLKSISLNQILMDVYQAFRVEAKQKEIELALRIPAEGIPFLGDEERLKQVLYNLISNSLKNTPAHKGITLGLENKDGVKIYVEDQGEGIDSSELNKIKDRFYRTEEARADRKEGLGLGLAISHYLVKAHGGELVLSSEGKGKGMKAEINLSQSISR